MCEEVEDKDKGTGAEWIEAECGRLETAIGDDVVDEVVRRTAPTAVVLAAVDETVPVAESDADFFGGTSPKARVAPRPNPTPGRVMAEEDGRFLAIAEDEAEVLVAVEGRFSGEAVGGLADAGKEVAAGAGVVGAVVDSLFVAVAGVAGVTVACAKSAPADPADVGVPGVDPAMTGMDEILARPTLDTVTAPVEVEPNAEEVFFGRLFFFFASGRGDHAADAAPSAEVEPSGFFFGAGEAVLPVDEADEKEESDDTESRDVFEPTLDFFAWRPLVGNFNFDATPTPLPPLTGARAVLAPEEVAGVVGVVGSPNVSARFPVLFLLIADPIGLLSAEVVPVAVLVVVDAVEETFRCFVTLAEAGERISTEDEDDSPSTTGVAILASTLTTISFVLESSVPSGVALILTV